MNTTAATMMDQSYNLKRQKTEMEVDFDDLDENKDADASMRANQQQA